MSYHSSGAKKLAPVGELIQIGYFDANLPSGF
ncbi:hypothetical protein LINGRAHAP2_LOCUS5192 [Linum grandiflorum]